MIIRLIASLFLSLFAILAIASDTVLEPEDAFKLSAKLVGTADARVLEVHYDIAEGYYLYRDKFKFAVQFNQTQPNQAQLATLGQAQFQHGEIKQDENFGRVEIYHHATDIRLPITVPQEIRSINLQASSQGCAEIGLCYPPQTQVVQITAASAATPISLSTPSSAILPNSRLNESSRVTYLLKHASFWMILLSFFGFGVLIALTPCMFPMIPILSGVIIGHGHRITKRRAFFLSGVYVISMALAYAIAGVAAGLSGTLLSSALQNPWVLGGFSVTFVLLALSMFGVYELQMPVWLQTRLASTTRHQEGGSFHGVALMGALSALIVGPCVAAPLAGALLYIAKTRDALLGGSALFAMGLGIGLPLIAIGVSARSFLPKPGHWMELVKKFFGVLLLIAAVWIVWPVLPIHNKNNTSEIHALFHKIKTLTELEVKLTHAQQPVMLDFYADWCTSCKDMERSTFADPRVKAKLSTMTLLMADVSNNTDADRALLKRFDLFGPPGIIFFDTHGKELNNIRVIGYQSADEFLSVLNSIATH